MAFVQKEWNRFEKHHQKTLTKKQTEAIHYLLETPRLRCLVGRAGTGKSFSLSAAKAIWQAKGLRVLGVALSGIAADGLVKDAGIPSSTIESFKYQLQAAHLKLNQQDVIIWV